MTSVKHIAIAMLTVALLLQIETSETKKTKKNHLHNKRAKRIKQLFKVMKVCQCPVSCVVQLRQCLTTGQCAACKVPTYGRRKRSVMSSLFERTGPSTENTEPLTQNSS